QETDGPEHVVLNTNEYSVDIPMTSKDGSSVNYDVHVYPKNETIRGGAVLTKYANDSEELLNGVKIGVYHTNEDPVLDEDGDPLVLTTVDGTVTVTGLAFGSYYFQEIESVEGFLLNGEKVNFTINEQKEVVNVSLQNYSKPEVEKEVDKEAVNRGEEVTFTISVTLPKDISEYEHFAVIDTLDERLEYVVGSQSDPAGFEFD